MSSKSNLFRRPKAAVLAAVGALAAGAALAVSVPAWAQGDRDPVYAAARAAGQVGERRDGYLGFVVPPSPALQRVIDDVNAKRRDLYTARAVEKKSTVQEYAFTAGCRLIAATEPGEKYQAPDNTWQIRTTAAPLRDPGCPAAGAPD